jgi:nicotinate-nucleotide pyrophosphorylase
MKKIIELIKKLLSNSTKAEKAVALEQLNTEVKAEVEVVKETIEEVKEALAIGGFQRIMFDNFTFEDFDSDEDKCPIIVEQHYNFTSP